jgi:hypothetical protein
MIYFPDAEEGASGAGVNRSHRHAESSHSYALVIATFHISTYRAAWNGYLHGFPTLACPHSRKHASDQYFPHWYRLGCGTVIYVLPHTLPVKHSTEIYISCISPPSLLPLSPDLKNMP